MGYILWVLWKCTFWSEPYSQYCTSKPPPPCLITHLVLGYQVITVTGYFHLKNWSLTQEVSLLSGCLESWLSKMDSNRWSHSQGHIMSGFTDGPLFWALQTPNHKWASLDSHGRQSLLLWQLKGGPLIWAILSFQQPVIAVKCEVGSFVVYCVGIGSDCPPTEDW